MIIISNRWPGNEPDLLAPWSFVFAGNEYATRTQHWVRWTLEVYYTAEPSGMPGNDDYGACCVRTCSASHPLCVKDAVLVHVRSLLTLIRARTPMLWLIFYCCYAGEMSAWAAFGLLGLYPLAGTQTYILGVPAFANATISLPATALRRTRASGSTGTDISALLTIVAHNFSSTNIWAYRASINGLALPTPFVNHSQLVPPAFRTAYDDDLAAPASGVGESVGASPALLEFWLTDQEVAWGA